MKKTESIILVEELKGYMTVRYDNEKDGRYIILDIKRNRYSSNATKDLEDISDMTYCKKTRYFNNLSDLNRHYKISGMVKLVNKMTEYITGDVKTLEEKRFSFLKKHSFDFKKIIDDRGITLYVDVKNKAILFYNKRNNIKFTKYSYVKNVMEYEQKIRDTYFLCADLELEEIFS